MRAIGTTRASDACICSLLPVGKSVRPQPKRKSLVTLEAGVPIETISSMLGHSNIQTTQVYARVTPKKLFEDMDRLIEATGDFKLVL